MWIQLKIPEVVYNSTAASWLYIN